MLIWIKQTLAPPIFEDQDKTRVAKLLNIILLTMIVTSILYFVARLFTPSGNLTLLLLAAGFMLALSIGMLVLMRAGQTKPASIIFTGFFWGLITLMVFSSGGVRGAGYTTYLSITLIAGLLLGGRTALGFAGASIVGGLTAFLLERNGIISPNLSNLTLEGMFSNVTPSLIIVGVLVYLYDRGFTELLQRARSNERAMAEHAEQLQAEIAEREQAEKELRESEARVKNIAANIPSGAVYQFKLDAEGQRSFPYVSAGWHDLIGISPEEAQADPESSFAHVLPEDLPEVERTIALSATTLELWRCEFRIQAEGKIKWILGSAAPEPQADGILWSGVMTDITARKEAEVERGRLQQEIIEAQKQAIYELSTPVIPIMDNIMVMPLIGSIDSLRARDITRALLSGISQHRAKVVILDVTGVGIMDTGIVNHLNKTIQAARLKGAQTIVTGVSDAVAEAIVDLGIDWSGVETLSDLQTGLMAALHNLGVRLTQ